MAYSFALASVLAAPPAAAQSDQAGAGSGSRAGGSPERERGEGRTQTGTDSRMDIDGLASDRYVDRQRATVEMWRHRDQSRQAVQDAARHPDPEVAQRAEWILKQWRSGALPGVRDREGRWLIDRNPSSALATVLERGAFEAVRVAVEESAGTIEYEQIKQRVARALTERFPIYADRAFADGSEADLRALLEAVAVNRNLVVAWRDLSIHLGMEDADSLSGRPPERWLPEAAAVWQAGERSLCRAQLAMASGQPEQAVRFARQSGEDASVRVAQMIAGRWSELTAESFVTAEAATDADEKVEAFVWALCGATRSDDRAGVDTARAFLAEVSPEASAEESAMATNLRWRSLAVHGDVDQAIDVLAEQTPALAAQIACESSRFERGFELCGLAPEAIDSELEDRITAAFVDQAALPAGQLAPSIERLYALGRLLHRVGRVDQARRLYQRLTPREIIVSAGGASLREQTVIELDQINRPDWIKEFAVDRGENAATSRMQRIIAYTLDTEYDAFRKVLDRVKVILPRSEFRQRFQITFDLFLGDTPPEFASEDGFQELFDLLTHDRPTQRSGRNEVQRQRVILDAELLDMLIRNGQVELARRGMEMLAREGDLDAIIGLAETETEHGDSATAGPLWDRVAEQASRFTATETILTLDHGLAYAKAVVGQWILAQRRGHRELAAELESRVRLMLASPSLAFRKQMADHLRELGEHALAVEVLRDLIVHVSFGGSEAPDFFRVAVAYVGSLEDLREADPAAFERLGIDPRDLVRWSDLAVLGILKNNLYHETAFISVPLSVSKTRLQHAIRSGDAALAERAIAQIEALDPLNIDSGERMLPDAREAGMEKLANDALNRLIDRGLDHVAEFGTDATALNNLAWAAAMNGRRLEDALRLSRLAVTLQPDSVVYRDTLAEVLHLRGRTDQALAIETACLLDEPDQWHVHQQIEKYRRALGQGDGGN